MTHTRKQTEKGVPILGIWMDAGDGKAKKDPEVCGLSDKTVNNVIH